VIHALLLALVLLGSAALAQNAAQDGRVGGDAEVTIVQRGAGQPSAVEVRTDPEVTGQGELFYFLILRDHGVMARGAVPPEAPGLYRFEITVPEAGEWGLSLRHGVGLDLYYAFNWFRLDPESTRTRRWEGSFSSELGADTPQFVQPLGFGIFALVALCSLLLVFAVLRWLRRQGARLPDVTHA